MHGYDLHTSYIFTLVVLTANDTKYTELLFCQGSSEEVGKVTIDATNLIWIWMVNGKNEDIKTWGSKNKREKIKKSPLV